MTDKTKTICPPFFDLGGIKTPMLVEKNTICKVFVVGILVIN